MTHINDSALKDAISDWLKWDKNPQTSNEIQRLVAENSYDELKKCLLKRMEFGTAGLRAEMGPGNSRMNELTIIQTTQGFSAYLQEKFGNKLKDRGVVIGFDARHNSARFAELATNVFIKDKIKVYLFSKITPTPFVPYGVLRYKACAGIMVTASHNPKQDNGYKVYWENGAQIIPPHDTGIATAISRNLAPCSGDLWSKNTCRRSSDVTNPYDDVMEAYYDDLKKYCHHRSTNKSTKIRFTYTPVHGVGQEFAQRSFKCFDLPLLQNVPEQMKPDPEFPTVKYPNPEEGKGVLSLAFQIADGCGSRVILANDPDADRLAVAEKQPDQSWKVFSGNELGALFGWWAWTSYINSHPDVKDRSNVYMLSSTVSSMILQSIARAEGFSFEDTLTGFKWMGSRTHELIKQGKTVLYAFEEAIGYMFGTNVLDKDGISAMAVIGECACALEAQGLTLTQQLQRIYDKYGDHVSSNSYYISRDAERTDAMFARLRNFDNTANNKDVIADRSHQHRYPHRLGRFPITDVRDLTTGFDSRSPDGIARLPSSAGSHMITFYFDNEVVLTIRTSGTEPKIKYYSEMRGRAGKSREDVEKELNELVALMCREFYRPEKNGFLPRPV